MDMRSCWKLVKVGEVGDPCIMPEGHAGDCETVASDSVRAAWRSKRGEGLKRHSWLCKACGGEYIVGEATSNRMTELKEQLVSRTHALTAAAGVMTALSVEKAELKEENTTLRSTAEQMRELLVTGDAALREQLGNVMTLQARYDALKTAVLAAAEAIERGDFGFGAAGHRHATEIRAALKGPDA